MENKHWKEVLLNYLAQMHDGTGRITVEHKGLKRQILIVPSCSLGLMGLSVKNDSPNIGILLAFGSHTKTDKKQKEEIVNNLLKRKYIYTEERRAYRLVKDFGVNINEIAEEVNYLIQSIYSMDEEGIVVKFHNTWHRIE